MIKIILLTLISWNGPKIQSDSLRLETIDGKQFIIHQVNEKETLYGISKRYGVTIMSILEYNKTADGGLEVGQILKVPYVPKSKVQTSSSIVHKVAAKETLFSISKLYDVSVDDIKLVNNLKDNSLALGQELIIRKSTQSTTEVAKPREAQSNKGTHTVAAKETLFSISKQYGITVQQLKDWNGIIGSELKIDQVLVVAQPSTKTEAPKTEMVTPNQSARETPPRIINDLPKETTIKISENVAGSDEIKERGVAELIDGTEGNRKYLALYNGAKIGTIVKVRNEANNREVFVRVTGALPSGTDTKTVIRISKSAIDRLGALEGKFGVEVTFYK